MVDWHSQLEVGKDALAFSRFMHVLLGVYLWEWVCSLPFDWDFIICRRAFRWPLIFYFLNRYCLLFALIGIAIALNVTTEISCQALYITNQVLGNSAIGFASINLSLRTVAVWERRALVWVPLVAISVGQFTLLGHGVLLEAKWIPGQGCIITSTSNRILAITFIYTMAFDFLVLCLTAWRLLFPTSGRSHLVRLIFNDGLIYFVLAFLSNLLATIFMLLNLNAVMSIIANVPAAIASTIVACRAVRRLANYNQTGPQVFGQTTNSTMAFRNTGGGLGAFGGRQATTQRPRVASKVITEGVHIHMETQTFESPATATERSCPDYEAAEKLPHSPLDGARDPEAQLDGAAGNFERDIDSEY